MKIFKTLIFVCAIAFSLPAAAADLQDTASPKNWGSIYGASNGLFTNNFWGNGLTNSLTPNANTSIRVIPGYRLTLFPTISSTGTAVSAVTIKLWESTDGTVWNNSTNFPYSGSIALTGATTNIAPIYVGSNFVSRYLAIGAFTCTESCRVARVQYTWMPSASR